MRKFFTICVAFLSVVAFGQDDKIYVGTTKDGQEIYSIILENEYMLSLYTYKKVGNTDKYSLGHKSLLEYKCEKDKEHMYRRFYTVFYKNGVVVDFIDDSVEKSKFSYTYPNTINELLAKCVCNDDCSTNKNLDKDELPDFFRKIKNAAEKIQ